MIDRTGPGSADNLAAYQLLTSAANGERLIGEPTSRVIAANWHAAATQTKAWNTSW